MALKRDPLVVRSHVEELGNSVFRVVSNIDKDVLEGCSV